MKAAAIIIPLITLSYLSISQQNNINNVYNQMASLNLFSSNNNIEKITQAEAKNNITKGVLSNLEDGAVITSSGTYQKGFTNTELKNYVSELLGKDFKVENITGLGKAGIKVTKL